MRPVYSTQFIHTGVVTTGTIDYTVPTGYRAVVKTATSYRAVAATGVVIYAMIFSPSSGPASVFWLSDLSAGAALLSGLWNGMVVANAGQTIRMGRASAAGSWAGTCSGYLLLVP